MIFKCRNKIVTLFRFVHFIPAPHTAAPQTPAQRTPAQRVSTPHKAAPQTPAHRTPAPQIVALSLISRPHVTNVTHVTPPSAPARFTKRVRGRRCGRGCQCCRGCQLGRSRWGSYLHIVKFPINSKNLIHDI